ncbi:TrmH family RNA methyltransferase [Orenia marismortui]|uniref:TrmH family RNA methyltransferase n=1 Tax=Orenia marismortui TaxID=46469 RepID=A0A4R8H204_9FIRM|nr:RNA methyltransferase [Orenia marismortui]TDX49086.1 TrmH family RNA methyltransferase [Orenia marismortui]
MEISSFTNDRIKYLRSLYRKKYRRQENRFVLEGVRIIEEAIKEKANIHQVFYSNYLLRNQRGEDLVKDLKTLNIEVVKVSDNIIQKVADTESPQGILAIIDKVEYSLSEILDDDNNLILIVDQVQDPGNLGTIIRTADAAGIDGVITTKGTVSLYNQKTIRATMGSLFRVPIYRENDLLKLKNKLIAKNINLVVGDINANKYHFEVDYLASTAFLVGNEGNGPRKELIDLADEMIKIPLIGDAESLNVAMASGIIIYEAVRQRIDMG